MKNIVFLFLITLWAYLLCGLEFRPKKIHIRKDMINSIESRIVPDWEYNCEPTMIHPSFFDRFIGGDHGYPLDYQSGSDNSVMTYTVKATSDSQQRSYLSIIAEDGMLLFSDPSNHSGPTSVAYDNRTGASLLSFDQYNFQTNRYEIALSWYQEDTSITFLQSILLDEVDDYLSPVIYIGNSPIPNKSRVYIFANCSGVSVSGLPSPKVKLAYADFDQNNLSNNIPLIFTMRSFSYLEGLHNSTGNNRVYLSYNISENGKIALVGYANYDTSFSDSENPSLIYNEHNLAVMINNNFGEGDFNTYTYNIMREVEAPTNEGEVPDPELSECSDFKIRLMNNYRNNIAFDLQGKLHIPAIAGVTFYQTGEGSCYWPLTQTIHDLVFNPTNQTISIKTIWPQSYLQNNELLCLWDIDNDGLIDEYDYDGHWVCPSVFPFEYWDPEFSCKYGYIRISNPDPNGLMIASWIDTTKSQFYNLYNYDEYQSFASIPEFMISSYMSGYWSEPIRINSLSDYYFQDIIPSSVYLSQKARCFNEENVLMDFLFYDDNSYGSSFLGHGLNNGGQVVYMSININVYPIENKDIIASRCTLSGFNYPNPFNPSTTINYNVPTTGQVNLAVYNLKGQLVQTLVNGVMEKGNHKITWNGQDNKNQTVSSGVYFYKINTGQYSELKKMVLVK